MARIIITGASDGIGAEMARQLAQTHGSRLQLTLAARNAGNLQAVAEQCRALGAQVLEVPTDVSEEAQCRALIDAAVQQFGGVPPYAETQKYVVIVPQEAARFAAA